MPKVSVITPCYNSVRYVRDTVLSVRAQSLADWEQIVVDDGSTDGSAESIADLPAADPRIRVIRQPNGGVARARNAGYRAASTDSKYLLFLDADDVLEPDMLRVMTDYLDDRPAVALAYCDPTFINASGEVMNVTHTDMGWCPRYAPSALGIRLLGAQEPETPLESIFAAATIVPSISVIRNEVYRQTPGFDESFGHLFEDTDVVLQVALRGAVHHVPQRLVRYRRHGAQSTANAVALVRQQEKLARKWHDMPGLTPDQRARVRRAEWFTQYRLPGLLGWGAGARRLRQGQPVNAARHCAGALWRYAVSVAVRP